MTRLMLAVSLMASAFFGGEAWAQEKTIVETAVESGNFNTLIAALKAADLIDTLDGHSQFTVFAPTDDAFSKVAPETIQYLLKPENKAQLANVLTYHLMAGRVLARNAYDLNSAKTINGQRLLLNFRGDSLSVGDATITVTDIPCSNGIIHVIDTVLLPTQDTIPAIAAAAGKFATLLAAVESAGLSEFLSGPGPFTVFAPTDEAFDGLPAGTIESLLQPENRKKLADILKFHVISGRVYANDAVKAGRAKTLLGPSLSVDFSAAGIQISNSKVVARNIEASNGVIHVIDQVLIPSNMTRSHAMKTLTSAIDQGVPKFNSGDHAACCTLYMEAMESIAVTGIENMDDHTLLAVRHAIDTAKNTHNVTERTWVLRRGMDTLYNRLSSMSMQTQTSR